MTASAVMLACGFRMRFGYVPSESNPADRPSRGLRQLVRTRISKLARPSRFERIMYNRSIDHAFLFDDAPFSGSSLAACPSEESLSC